jgi:hypothetical protein
MADYATDLLSQATQAYPFVAKHNPMVVVNPAEDRGYAETYPIGETGAPLPEGGFNKHPDLPIDRVGVEVFKPNQFTHHDLAAEMLHIDPFANQTREALIKTWSPKQIETLRKHALDYDATIAEGRSPADALQNATDSALRGYTVGQWPEEINKALKYSPAQLKVLESLKSYMATGSEPKSRKQLIEEQINNIGVE